MAATAFVAGGFTATKIYAADDAVLPRGRAKSLPQVANKLELSFSQRSQIHSIIVANRDYLKALIGRLLEAKANLRDAIHAGDATETSVCMISSKSAQNI